MEIGGTWEVGVGEHLWRRGILKAVARRVIREGRTMRSYNARSHSGKVGESCRENRLILSNQNDDFFSLSLLISFISPH